MKPLKLHSWGVINKAGDHFLNPLETDLRDMCIVGKYDVRILSKTFKYRIETTPIVKFWRGVIDGEERLFILTTNDDKFELCGEPMTDYARLFHIDRARFVNVVTRKLKMI